MYNFFRLLISLFMVVQLASCALPQRQTSDVIVDEDDYYKYPAWRLNGSSDFEAINVLLREADHLIENRNINAAVDKLERLLRIRPDYAPAWSRLSWLALQANTPERAVQMAKRSNSFAYSNMELQTLNWSFIRTASQMMNDEEAYRHANEKLKSLKAF
jgi:tetratricopeptide (TPR) repeat protein